MEAKYDLFISYVHKDKSKYIDLLVKALQNVKITYWLDSINIKPGDNIVMKINEGMRKCKYTLLCLSENFIGRPWPETEMSAALNIQNSKGEKCVIPLILNCRKKILEKYSILNGLSYITYNKDPYITALKLYELLSDPSAILYDEGLIIDGESLNIFIELNLNYGKYTEVVEYLENALLNRKEPDELYWIYITLGKIGGQSALEIIKRGLSWDNDYVRSGAEKALMMFD